MKFGMPITGAIVSLITATLQLPLPANAIEKAQIKARASASQPVEFDIYLPIQHEADLDALIADQQNPSSTNYRHWLTPQQFHDRFAPSEAQVSKIKQELSVKGLDVTEVHTHSLHVVGSVGAVENAFATQIANATFSSGKTTLAATRPITLSPTLASIGATVVGLSSTIHMHSGVKAASMLPENRYSPGGPYWFDDLKQAYSYPSYQVYNGKGATIGVLMESGFKKADMDMYFGHEKLATPNIQEVKIHGGAPFDPNSGASFETALDIQQSGGMAPKATIVLYNLADLNDSTILDGIRTILETNRVDVVNMSFGGPELGFTKEYNGGVDFTGLLTVYDNLFKQGNAQGITFVASSGDSGALGIPPSACFASNATSSCGTYRVSVESPASSPHVTAVGGTNLLTTFSTKSSTLDSAYIKEQAYGDVLTQDIFFGTPAKGAFWGSGGGVSIFFTKPWFQTLVNTGSPMRTIPDLALHMGGCPGGSVSPCKPDRSSVVAAVGGGFFLLIGTSASAPDFTGLLALRIQKTGGRLGNENYDIYTLAAAQNSGSSLRVYHDDIPGFNGKYSSKKGYNYVVGNGTLYGKDFIHAPNVPSAGIPQTPTNP
jgi:subtilase family serine protease